MTSKVITARPGIDLEHAKELLQAHRIEKLPLVDDQNRLRGLITVKDMDKAIRHPHASKDQLGRLRVGAAVGVGPEREARVAALRRAGVDVICIDTAHGHTRNVIDAIKATKSEWPEHRSGRGKRRDQRGREGIVRRRRRRAAGRDGAGIDLHDARDLGRRRAADHGDYGHDRGCRAAQYPGDRGRRNPVLGRYHQGACGGREQRDDWIAVRGHRGKPRRDDSLPGAHLQIVSRDGIDRRDERAHGRSLRTAAREPTASMCRRESRAACRIAGRSRRISSSSSAGCNRGWATSARRIWRSCAGGAKFVKVSDAGMRESHVHDVFITKEAPNYRQ